MTTEHFGTREEMIDRYLGLRESMRLDALTMAAKDAKIAELERALESTTTTLAEQAQARNGTGDSDARRWQWCVEHPYETMMILMEATNRDTFQMDRQPSLEQTRDYFVNGVMEEGRGLVQHAPGYEPSNPSPVASNGLLLDCLAGKLTTLDAIAGYVSRLELDAEELANALRDVLAGHPVRNADELIARYSPLKGDPRPLSGRSGWIPVEERLPPNAEHVLVVTDIYFYPYSAIRGEGHFQIDMGGGSNWYDTDGPGAKVTHWMPLPANPNVTAKTRNVAFTSEEK